LAIGDVINQNVFVFIAGKNIYPALNGKSYKIKTIGESVENAINNNENQP